jgi:hypothetical protein
MKYCTITYLATIKYRTGKTFWGNDYWKYMLLVRGNTKELAEQKVQKYAKEKYGDKLVSVEVGDTI